MFGIELETGNKNESYIHSPKEVFADFLQRLSLAVNKMVSDIEARNIIIETMGFENTKCKVKLGL